MILFDSVALDFVAITVALFTALYIYFARWYNLWKDLGIPYVKPLPFIGSLKTVSVQKESLGIFLKKVYEEYKGEPYVGLFSFDQPALMLRDLELVKNVLVKDSQNFIDRLITMDETVEPLTARNLFVMNGKKWKHVRVSLSPTFTSGKMKNMFYLVDKCGKELADLIESSVGDGQPFEVKDITARYTTDAIASCAFGIDSNAIKNPESEFRVKLRTVFNMTKKQALAQLLAFVAPGLLKIVRLRIVGPEVDELVRNAVWNTAKYREENGITRKDFLDFLMELRRKNKKLQGEDDDDDSVYKMVDDDYAAQALSFLTAGFETSSSTMSFALYELSLQPEIQSRLRTEIQQVLEKHDHKVTYDGMQEMTYLDMVVNETLRKYPILPFLDRRCLQDYELPAASGTGTVKIPAGTAMFIPLMGIHYDPEYYPEPNKFDPERFTEENKLKRPNYCHLPFGEGPRICIGMRFGLMQTKTGLIHILSRFEVAPCKNTPIPLVLDQKAVLLTTVSGIPLSIKRIKT